MVPNGPIMLAIYTLIDFDWENFDWNGLLCRLGLNDPHQIAMMDEVVDVVLHAHSRGPTTVTVKVKGKTIVTVHANPGDDGVKLELHHDDSLPTEHFMAASTAVTMTMEEVARKIL